MFLSFNSGFSCNVSPFSQWLLLLLYFFQMSFKYTSFSHLCHLFYDLSHNFYFFIILGELFKFALYILFYLFFIFYCPDFNFTIVNFRSFIIFSCIPSHIVTNMFFLQLSMVFVQLFVCLVELTPIFFCFLFSLSYVF